GTRPRSGTARCQRARVPRGGSGEIREGPGVVGFRLLVAEGTPAERSLGGVGGLPNLSRPRGASGHRPGQGRSTRLPGLPRRLDRRALWVPLSVLQGYRNGPWTFKPDLRGSFGALAADPPEDP